jgi:hypothetical protein
MAMVVLTMIVGWNGEEIHMHNRNMRMRFVRSTRMLVCRM